MFIPLASLFIEAAVSPEGTVIETLPVMLVPLPNVKDPDKKTIPFTSVYFAALVAAAPPGPNVIPP